MVDISPLIVTYWREFICSSDRMPLTLSCDSLPVCDVRDRFCDFDPLYIDDPEPLVPPVTDTWAYIR